MRINAGHKVIKKLSNYNNGFSLSTKEILDVNNGNKDCVLVSFKDNPECTEVLFGERLGAAMRNIRTSGEDWVAFDIP